MVEDNRTRLPRASTLAYKELRPIPPCGDEGALMQQELAEELRKKALADLIGVQNSISSAMAQGSLPAQLGNSLR